MAKQVLGSKTASRLVSFLLTFTLLFCQIPGAAFAEDALPNEGPAAAAEIAEEQAPMEEQIPVEEQTTTDSGIVLTAEGGSKYVSSIAVGSGSGNNNYGNNITWDDDNGYTIVVPDTRGNMVWMTVFGKGDAASDESNVRYTVLQKKEDGTKRVIGIANQKFGSGINAMYILSPMKNGLPVGTSSDFEIVIGEGAWNRDAFSFENNLEVIPGHCYNRVALKDLSVTAGGETLNLNPSFSSTTENYTASLTGEENTITVMPTTQTAGTVVAYTDADGKTISPVSAEDSTFTVDSLPKNETGHSYICVTVDYSDKGKEVGATTYRVQFSEPVAPEVEAAGSTTIEVEKNVKTVLEVRVTNQEDDDGAVYTYQWYQGGGFIGGAVSNGKILDGETKSTYEVDTTYAKRATTYHCLVTKTVNGISFTTDSPRFTVTISANYASPAIFEQQPEDIVVTEGANPYSARMFAVTRGLEEVTPELQWYLVNPDGEDIPAEQEMYWQDSQYTTNYRKAYFCYPDTSTQGVFQYYCLATVTVNGHTATAKSRIATLTVSGVEGMDSIRGDGSEDRPYEIYTVEDLNTVKTVVENGFSLAGKYLKLMNDLTLSVDWIPIGNLKEGHPEVIPPDDPAGRMPNDGTGAGVYVNPFSGHFNGGGNTITIADGGTGLFKYARMAYISDLKVYGKNIIGSALITDSFVDYGEDGVYDSGIESCWTANIDNVTLLSGSKTSGPGLVLGGGSGINNVSITNSIVEKGCETRSASFIGSLNGSIRNSVSYATVYGSGGLAAHKGQTMGDCTIENSAFIGTLISTGSAGGIIGTGYGDRGYREGDLSAPSSPYVVINNCYVHADITGTNKVGGIIGGEPASEIAGADITNNVFVGNIKTFGDTDAGGIIGYFKGISKFSTMMHNNYFNEDCGVEKGIGYVAELRRVGDAYGAAFAEGEEPDWDTMTTAVSRDKLTDGSLVPILNGDDKSYCNWIQGEKSPIHSDVAVLSKLEISGTYPTQYYIGDELNLNNAVFTATYSDGATAQIDLDEITIEGYNKDVRGVQTVTFRYGAVSCQIKVTVLLKPVSNNITVYFTLYGDTVHGEPTDATTHTMKANNLETWIPKTAYTIGLNDTVWDVIQQALAANQMTCSNPSGNYIESITKNGVTLGEFSNGSLSGWMFTLNGKHLLLGVSEQFLEDGDKIVFHYTDDYTREQGSEELAGGGSSGGSTDAAGTETTEVTTEMKPEVTANSQGEAVAKLEDKAVAETIEQAKKDKADVIVIQPEVKGEANKVGVELSKSAMETMTKETDADLTVKTDLGDVTVPAKGLKQLTEQSGSKVAVTVENKDGAAQIAVAVGDQALDQIDGGIGVRIPASNADSGNVLVIVNGDGSETIVKKSVADGKNVAAVVDGSCAVKIVDNSKTFSDTDGHWAKEAIAFAGSHELFSGTGAARFSPDAPMSRAMLATVLYHLEDGTANGSCPFADVPAGKWYTDAVTWANGAGIVQGTGKGFNPNGSITREQLATMLYNYAKTLGMDTTASGELNKFTDGDETARWASDAMKWAVGSGLISGKGSGRLDPKGSATRAEVAAILQHMIGMMVR